MLSQSIQEAINNQIRDEFYASMLYLSMSAYCEQANLPGCAKWMRKQSDEERGHALKFFDYVNDRGGRVMLQNTEQPTVEFASILDVFEKAFANERKVTSTIEAMYGMAVAEKDYATQVMLHWFIEEQIEEEKSVSDVIALLKMTGESGQSLVMIDRQLGAQ